MKTIEKEQVLKVLEEQGIKIKVGFVTCVFKPLTLAKIYEIGVIANNIKNIDLGEDGKVNVLQAMIEHHEDADILRKIFYTCMEKNALKRILYKCYIKKRLTIKHINLLIKFMAASFNVNFFLTSITFLKKTKTMTEPQTTPLGQLSDK